METACREDSRMAAPNKLTVLRDGGPLLPAKVGRRGWDVVEYDSDEYMQFTYIDDHGVSQLLFLSGRQRIKTGEVL
jgi:hypothetical protein